jgi:trimethylamine--corrinoid protein Co-methyltransferase
MVYKNRFLSLLHKNDIDDIHSSTLEVLENIGLFIDSELIMKVFCDGGLEVDKKKNIVKIPEYIIKESLDKAPKQVTLCGRNSKYDIIAGDKHVNFGMGGTPVPYIKDINSGEFRRPTRKDMVEATRLGDALPNMAFIMTIAGAYDVSYQMEYEYEWEILFNNTEKPIVYAAPNADTCETVLKMAAVVAGDEKKMRERPNIAVYSDLTAPLFFHHGNDNMVIFAKAGMPVIIGAGVQAALNGPVTMSGSIVISNAENLASIVLTQLVKPGTPIVYAVEVNAIDPFTARIPYGDPERAISTGPVNVQLAEFYNLPTFGYAGCTDSKIPDAQAGAEVMMHCLMSALSGVNLIHDCGYLASGSVGSMEMAVICNEVINIVKRITRGFDVNDESLAMDVIKEVGPRGSFMSHKHTLKFIGNEIYRPKLFDRSSEKAWNNAGKKDILKIANSQVKEILARHQPEPLSKDIQLILKDIVINAEKAKLG